MSLYRDQLESYLKTLDIKAEKLLDIGGGAGTLKGRVNSLDVGEYVILDNNIEEGKDIDIVADIQNIRGEVLGRYKNCFDMIVMLEVAEYLIDPLKALSTIWVMLKDGGEFYSSWPHLYAHHNPLEHDSLRYCESGIKKLFASSRLKIVEIVYRKATKGLPNLLEFYKAEGYHVAGLSDVTGFIVKAVKK